MLRPGHPIRRLVANVAASSIGLRLIAYTALERPDILFGALGSNLSRDLRAAPIVCWPDELAAFEDVAPLVLSSNSANHGWAAMSLVELAHLWRLASEAGAATLVEIGRERGGSTLVIAAASAPGATLYSYDPHTKLGPRGRSYDDELREALTRYRIEDRVRILAEDSHTAPLPEGQYALVLVDGDPRYEGTRLDFERFCRRLAPGGRALFHDAAPGGPRHADLAPLIEEIERDGDFERRPDVGSFVDFVRR